MPWRLTFRADMTDTYKKEGGGGDAAFDYGEAAAESLHTRNIVS